MVTIYDSMRVRDDLRENGDNVFWVKEEDYLKVTKENKQLRTILEDLFSEPTENYIECLRRFEELE